MQFSPRRSSMHCPREDCFLVHGSSHPGRAFRSTRTVSPTQKWASEMGIDSHFVGLCTRERAHTYCSGGVAEWPNAAVLMDAAMHSCRAVVIGSAEKLVPFVVPFSSVARVARSAMKDSMRMHVGIVRSVD